MTAFRVAKVTELHVTCPYCELGHGTVLVEHKDGADQVHGIKDPRQCSKCGKFFALQIQFHVIGRRLEQTPAQQTPTLPRVIGNLS
jgi:ribosomal protein S27AE